MHKARYGFARRMARKVLKEMGIRRPPVDVRGILEKRGYEYMEMSTFLDGVDALIVDRYAAVNAEHSVQRQRFSIAHELGHKEMHHDIEYYRSHITIDNPPLSASHTAYEGTFEKEANAFAGEMLVPLEMLKKEFRRAPDVSELSEVFCVSKAVIDIAVKTHLKSLYRLKRLY